jgi:hypothetical protein
VDDTAAREFALTPYANLLGLIRADARESRYERIDPEAQSSVSPSSSAPAPPPPEEEPNWFEIGADGILRIGSAATDWSQGWL